MEVIDVDNLSYYYKKTLISKNNYSIKIVKEDEKCDLKIMVENYEKEIIKKELEKRKNNISATAKALGITRRLFNIK